MDQREWYSQHAEAEQQLLECLMASPDAVYQVVDQLQEDHFAVTTHQVLWTACQCLVVERQPITATGLWRHIKPYLTDANELDFKHYLQKLGRNAVYAFPHHVGYYVGRVVEQYKVRRLAAMGETVGQYAETEGSEKATDALYDLLKGFNEIGGKALKAISELQEPTLAYLSQKQYYDPATCAKTGLKPLDDLLGPMMPGQMTVVAARPGVGKTIMACTIAQHMARQARAVLLLSLEMSHEEMTSRLADQVKRATGQVAHAVQEVAQLPITIGCTPRLTTTKAEAYTRQVAGRQGPPVVIVDYLGLMHGFGKSLYERTTAVSNELKQMALACQVPLIVMAQLNRENEKRADKRPVLSDLRDSGSIEQDADKVVLLHREEDDDRMLEAIVAKNRQGKRGSCKL